MRRLFSLLGLILFVTAAIILWVAFGPQPEETRTTGGVLTTQPEIASQAAPGIQPDLAVTTDQGPSSTNVLSAAPAISPSALEDVTALDTSEETAAPQLTAPSANLTTDVMLDTDTGVAVAPLTMSSAAAPSAPVDGQGGPTAPGAFEQRVVELEWPTKFRVGGAGTVRIKLKVLGDGSLQPIAEIADNEVIATPILITNRYETHTATVTATISAPDFDIEWVSSESQPLEQGGEAEWRWTLEAKEAQRAVIVLGLAITWTPKQEGQPVIGNTPIWGQALQVESNYVFGSITVPQAGIGGAALAVLGVLAQIPLLDKILEVFWRILFGRRRRTTRQQSRRR